jgi:hypothetical protein
LVRDLRVFSRRDEVEQASIFEIKDAVEQALRLTRRDLVTADSALVRINILVDNCFRAKAWCEEPACVATAQYVVAEEECVNY